jgi:hypothetical protein
MKYRIFPFILVILLAGCTGKHNDGDQAVTATDSIPKTTKVVSLIDSVFDPEFRKVLMKDSVELIAVEHSKSGANKMEVVTYIDHEISCNYRYWNDLKSRTENIIKQIKSGTLMIVDTNKHINNPFPDMNGSFVRIDIYKGQFVYFMDQIRREHIITDSMIIELQFDSINTPITYISANRKENGVTTFKLSYNGHSTYLEIKRLRGKYDLQLWKWTNDDSDSWYELRGPIGKGLNFPQLYCRNNKDLTVEIENQSAIKFDHINYDSLFNSK